MGGYTGAFQHALFGCLDTHCRGASLCPAVGSHWLSAIERTFLNQFIFVPMLYLPLFFMVSGIARGQGLATIKSNILRLYVPLLTRNWLFWLPVQCLFFGMLAPRFVVPATCVAG